MFMEAHYPLLFAALNIHNSDRESFHVFAISGGALTINQRAVKN